VKFECKRSTVLYVGNVMRDVLCVTSNTSAGSCNMGQ